MKIKGTQLFVEALIEEGVDTLFAYPGGMAIDLFDALYGETAFRVVLPRHEQGLVHAADGYARATGKTGVCLVTSGPGATNLVTGIATANYDSVPLVCFTGQVPTNLIGNDAFQEVDIVGICRPVCKYAVTVRRREDLGRIIKEAFYIARTGKPGPVLVDFPKDIQNEPGSDEYPQEVSIRGYKPSSGVHMGQLKKAAEMLANAKRPLFLAGGGVNISRAQAAMTRLAELTGVPVVTTVMGKGALPADHPLYIGNMGMHGNVASNTAVSECDLLFSIGTRFNDRITGKLSEFAKNAKIVHIDIDAASISRNIVVDVPIVADAGEAIGKFTEICTPPKHTGDWVSRLQKLREEKPITISAGGALSPQDVIEAVNRDFAGAVVTTDVGQNQMWTTQFLQIREGGMLLTSGGLGTMGYGLPAAAGQAGQARRLHFGRRRLPDERAGARHRRVRRASRRHLYPQQFLPRQRAAVAGDVLRRQVFLHLPQKAQKLRAVVLFPLGAVPAVHPRFREARRKLRHRGHPRRKAGRRRPRLRPRPREHEGAHSHRVRHRQRARHPPDGTGRQRPFRHGDRIQKGEEVT